MCTSVILFQKKSDWPLILASNRDGSFRRPSKTPGRHWNNQKYILGGLDKEAGGTWCAINNNGVIGCIHNRNFKNHIKKKTRGEIILKILKGKNAIESINLFKKLDISYYNGFNLFIADNKNAFWIKYFNYNKKFSINKIPQGLSIITNKDLNDTRDKKIKYYKKLFSIIKKPNPEINSWKEWENLMASSRIRNQTSNDQAICFNIKKNFGTVSSTIIALSADKKKFKYRYTKKSPNICKFKEINLL